MDEDTKVNLELIKILETAITEGKWDGGLFFQAAGKKLRDLRDRIKSEINIDVAQPLTQAAVNTVIKYSGLIDIYVSLYNAEGQNIYKWENILTTISRQAITRPIYKKEKDVREVITAKENQTNDAYIIAYVNETSITKTITGKPLLDRFGHELLVLKENSIVTNNIAKFIHSSGEYSYEKGKLVKLTQLAHEHQ